jgi:hypothetical protein
VHRNVRVRFLRVYFVGLQADSWHEC